ncbi:MAG: class I SAM-dependent methyltransferase [Candidatus Cyclonatronum sp.]|uniref:class I SAM-dependent methyltransferase n=1 Tax=Cyclonatronum sp. TaxID=3024185 RepID=UPI0025C0AFC1|nr:class I SAM-dependent methyltransferase [Cyclonatronum sp.]MCC5934133.1 class I SAM-dependent methyltransferase [Balneolales bacterium]MCH8486250.1 class I SAM-dependent methyltransferase [Cyclonatronum sp.]
MNTLPDPDSHSALKPDVAAHNRMVWDRYVAEQNRWTVPVSGEQIRQARTDLPKVLLTPVKFAPHNWFPELNGCRVLGLAAAGGQQGPLLAAAGAAVTIFDNSENQLRQDRRLSDKYGLGIKTIQGDMADLSALPDAWFDLIFNPCSVVFTEDVNKVWQQCFRVLKPGGVLMAGMVNPVIFQFEPEGPPFKLTYPQPYSDLKSLSHEKLNALLLAQETLEFGHSLTDQIGGQLKAGFVITDFYEDDRGGEKALDTYLPSFFATRAVRKMAAGI